MKRTFSALGSSRTFFLASGFLNTDRRSQVLDLLRGLDDDNFRLLFYTYFLLLGVYY